jgi:predicted transcriptional regulator
LTKREPVLIYMEILATLISGPRGPTRLAQACNLNYARMERFAKPLLEKGLIRLVRVEGQEGFAVTDEGYRVYNDWLEVWRRLPID